jgi:hypothetical protein
MLKLMNHEELSAPERAALKRHEKDKEERLRWQYYNSIPQKHWRSMSGRQTKRMSNFALLSPPDQKNLTRPPPSGRMPRYST